MAVTQNDSDFSFIHRSGCYVMLAILLLTCKRGLKLALGGSSGRRESLELDVGYEEEEDSKNDARVLACGWWNHSQGERVLKEDQGRPDTGEFDFGHVELELSLRDPRRKQHAFLDVLVLNLRGEVTLRKRNV